MFESRRTLLRFWLIAFIIMCGSLAKIAMNGPFENRTRTCKKGDSKPSIKCQSSEHLNIFNILYSVLDREPGTDKDVSFFDMTYLWTHHQ